MQDVMIFIGLITMMIGAFGLILWRMESDQFYHSVRVQHHQRKLVQSQGYFRWHLFWMRHHTNKAWQAKA